MMDVRSSRKSWQLISALIILILITLLMWCNRTVVHEKVPSFQKNNDANRPEDFSPNRALIKRENTEPSRSIYQYVEEQPAGQGSNIEEYQRLRRFLATQGTICDKIQRIGGAPSGRPYGPDGAWDVCFDVDVGLVRGSCIVYSFGIGTDFSFDDGMAYYGCQVFSFDPTTGKEDHQHSERVQFFNTGLADHDQEGNGKAAVDPPPSEWKTRTLASVMKDLNHRERVIDIVKMDIESNEWSSLHQMLQDGTLYRKVRQLVVEFHLISGEPNGIRRYYSIIQWLTRQGMKVFSLHQNVYCEQCLEMSFINTRLSQEYNSTFRRDVFAW